MEKVKGILAYLFGWIGGLIVLFACKNEKNTNIHAAQSVVISLTSMVCGLVLSLLPIPFLGTIVGGLLYVLSIVGIIKVCISENAELPIVYGIAKSLFAGKIEG